VCLGHNSFNPFLSLILLTTPPTLVSISKASPLIYDQWLNTHYGKAYPYVNPLRCAVNPNDSATGK